MAPAVVKELEKYTNCILCGACYGACPVVAQNPDYLGPAALAKLYRFAIDPRENQNDSRLLMANQPNGWWACKFYNDCKKVCPKDVPPNFAIGSARLRLQEMGVGPVERRATSDERRTLDALRGDGPPPWSGAFWTFQV